MLQHVSHYYVVKHCLSGSPHSRTYLYAMQLLIDASIISVSCNIKVGIYNKNINQQLACKLIGLATQD